MLRRSGPSPFQRLYAGSLLQLLVYLGKRLHQLRLVRLSAELYRNQASMLHCDRADDML